MGALMVMGPPRPVVRALVDAVNTAMTAHYPGHGVSARQRSWLACCLTAILVTKAVGWARVARARLGTSSLAALAWLLRHAKIPWEVLLVASVRVLLRHYGITPGRLVVDESDQQRAKSAKKSASLHDLRDHGSGGGILGQRLVLLLVVTPKLPSPLGVAFYLPAPERTAWYTPERILNQQGLPRKPRPPNPPSNPHDPTQQALALRVLAHCQTPHPALHGHGLSADALSGSAALMDGASALFGGVQVSSQLRSHQRVRVHKRERPVADDFAPQPGPPQQSRLRGGAEMVAIGGRARLYGCAHHPKRFVRALKYDGEDTSRDVMASALRWRTLDSIHAHTWRWLVEVLVQDWKAYEGWDTLAKQPGEEGSRRSVILSLLVDHCLFLHPAQHAQLIHNLPAYTVGSLRAQVQVECLVTVIEELVASVDPPAQLHRLNEALHEVFTFERSKKHMVQRQLGRLEPTPSLKYRASEVMRNMPALST
jgi:hypothetical protein